MTSAPKRFLATVILLGSIGIASQEGRRPRSETIQLAPGLYEIRVPPVNLLASVGPDGALLVDAGYEQMGGVIREELKKLGAGDVKVIVDTHWHFDHAGGNKTLGKGALIVAHREVLRLLSSDQTLLGEAQKAYPEAARPRLVFDQGLELLWNGETVEVIGLTGGHSGGDAIVRFKGANVIHIGDLVFADEFPFVDVEHGGSVLRIAENLRRVIDLAPPGARIVPGHGRMLSVEDLGKYREMVLATTETVRREMSTGKSLEAIRKSDVLKDWSSWGRSFTAGDWTEFVYRSLEAERQGGGA